MSWRGTGEAGYARALVAIAAAAVLCLAFADASRAAFPGANGRIAYTKSSYPQGTELWTANPDGGGATKLLAGLGVGAPAFSADGMQLTFEREGSIELIGADGSGRRTLIAGSEVVEPHVEWVEDYYWPRAGVTLPVAKLVRYEYRWVTFHDPAFAPDGATLAVTRSTGTEGELEVCPVDALGDDDCTAPAEPNSWLPEESCIACTANLVSIDSRNGAILDNLTSPSADWGDWEATYSAKGQLAFSRALDANGGAIMTIPSPGAAPMGLTAGERDHSPDFSPDGGTVFFLWGGTISTVPAAGGGIVPSELGGTDLAVSPDGTSLVAHRDTWSTDGIEVGLFSGPIDLSTQRAIVEWGDEPAWQPIPPPPPPPPPAAVRPRISLPKLVKLKGRRWALVGSLTCGDSRCGVGGRRARVRIPDRRKPLSARLHVRRQIAPGRSANVRVTFPRRTLRALRKAGKGRLAASVVVTDSVGALTLRPHAKLDPGRARKGKSSR